MIEQKGLGVIGAGKMGEAILRGLIQRVPSRLLLASDILSSRRKEVEEKLGVKVIADTPLVLKEKEVVILAVKPREARGVLQEISPLFGPDHLLISIVAGLTTRTISTILGERARIIRAMPNLPLSVGEGAIALTRGEGAKEGDLVIAEEVFSSVGRTVVVPEGLMDAVTGLSGSGPAYVALFIEALADAGVREGLDRETALLLSAQTVLGAARMILEGLSPSGLKEMVASPGGTTIEGLSVLEGAGVRGAVMEAVHAATRRSKELGDGKDKGG